jgi:hypothetical protein
MEEKRHIILTRLRSLFGVLIVASGWFAAPMALAARPADTCEMACCIQQHSCCCRTRHARVKGQLPDKGPQVSSSSAINSCPNGCANSQDSNSPSQTGANNTAVANLFPATQTASISVRPVIGTDDLIARSSTPRAPPALLS